MIISIRLVAVASESRPRTYLLMQTFHAGYSLCLLERVHLDAAFAYNALELVMDVIQHLAVYFQISQHSFIRILKTEPS